MEKTEIIKKETESLLKKLINDFTIEITEEDEVFHINIKTNEAATIIGRFGETIRSFQKILEVILFKIFNQPTNILVNVNDFRQKQKEKLERLVENTVQKVKETGKEEVKNLSSFERKLIHQMIAQNYPELTSYSSGEGKMRTLIITKKA